MPLRPKEPPKFYHQKFRRVPTIDECDIFDEVCKYEANEQFYRDREVDHQIVNILKDRYAECKLYAGPHAEQRCRDILEEYTKASADCFTKYGDLGVNGAALEAYMKQKHRMIYERRHGTHLREKSHNEA